MWPCGRLAKLAVCGGILKCVAGLARSRGTRAPGAILTREALSLSSGHVRSRGSVVAAPDTEEEVEDPLAPPEEWASPKPGRRPDIFPEFEKLKVRVFSGTAARLRAPRRLASARRVVRRVLNALAPTAGWRLGLTRLVERR